MGCGFVVTDQRQEIAVQSKQVTMYFLKEAPNSRCGYEALLPCYQHQGMVRVINGIPCGFRQLACVGLLSSGDCPFPVLVSHADSSNSLWPALADGLMRFAEHHPGTRLLGEKEIAESCCKY